jgi:hypothetical protein
MVDVHPVDPQRRLIQSARETPEDFVRARSYRRLPLEQVSNLLLRSSVSTDSRLVAKESAACSCPQVATEHDWDMKTSLEQACVRTELPKNAHWPDTMGCNFIEEEG